MKEECKKICKRALDTWGRTAQMMVVLEEFSELQKAILKNIYRKRDNIEEIIDETADVYIILEQLKMSYGIEDAVENRIEYKTHNIIKDRLDKWDEK